MLHNSNTKLYLAEKTRKYVSYETNTSVTNLPGVLTIGLSGSRDKLKCLK